MEYTCSYSFKVDNTKINSATITSSCALQDLTKSPEQIARSVLSKAMNRINGSMTLGAIYVTHLIMGHGDSYLSYDTQIVNFNAYVRHLHPSHAERLFPNASSAGHLVQTLVTNEDGSAGPVRFNNEVLTFIRRHPALHKLSPVELAMAFYLDRHPKKTPLPLCLDAAHPMATTHGHRKRSTFVLPQFVSDPPLRPADTAPLEDREAYAAYALTVFYSEHYIKDLEGLNMWEQLRSWEDLAQQGNGPRGADLDVFALRMLKNVETMAAARAVTRENNAVLKAARAAAKAAARAHEVRKSSNVTYSNVTLTGSLL